MSANYLHGVETIEIQSGPRPVKTVKSAVIALIGTAPCGPVNKATLCLSEKDAAQFGPALPGYTIPQALKAIYDHGAGTVIVINVMDPAIQYRSTVLDYLTFDSYGKTQLLYKVDRDVVLTRGSITLVEGSDYQLDAINGTIQFLGNTIPSARSVIATYKRADPTMINSAGIIGTIDANGHRTGMQLLNNTYSEFGFFPKILISPIFCTQKTVATELIGQAEKLDAIAYIDASVGATCAQVLTSRTVSGLNFSTSSERARLCYPYVKVYDSATNSEQLEPLSPRAAGLRAKVDLEKGFWWSNSNQEILGITGVERSLTARIDDPQSEVNQLNENGITTVFNNYGSGLRLWGNRTAAWPTVTDMSSFENVRRTADVINESMRYFSQQFMDMPINQALIDALTESVNGYGRKLIGDGALVGFNCWYDPARNEATELSAGHLLLSYKFTPPPPLERLTFETEITSEYLLTLKGTR